MSEEMMPNNQPSQTNHEVDGTDADALFKAAQDANRSEAWYGTAGDPKEEGGEWKSDDKLQAMIDHQAMMNERYVQPTDGGAITEVKPFVDEVKPLDETQEKQAQQSSDLEYLDSLFRESSEPEHVASAHKLFYEFIDKYNMTREQERALSEHFNKLNNKLPGPIETRSEMPSTDENTEKDQAAGPNESGEKPAEEYAEENPNDDSEKETSSGAQPITEAIEVWKPMSIEKYDKESSPEENESDKKSFSNLIKRAKLFPYAMAAKIETKYNELFNGDDSEKNKRNKIIAVCAIGTLVVGASVAVGLSIEHTNNASNAIGNIPKPNGSYGVASGSSEALRGVGHTIHEHLGGSGDTIWSHAKLTLEQWGVKPTNVNIHHLTETILKDNGLSWNSARHLHKGFNFVINQPSWTK